MQDPSANLQQAVVLLTNITQVFIVSGGLACGGIAICKVATFIRENWRRKPE